MRYRSKVPLWPHQEEGLRRLWRAGSALVWWDTGTGKTKLAVDYSLILHQAKKIQRVLVVCPLSAVGVWRREYSRHAADARIVTRHEGKSLSDVMLRIAELGSGPELRVAIVTYDMVRLFAKGFSTAYMPDLLIVDESHYCKSYSADRTKAVIRLARLAPYRLCLSGTPMPGGYIDIYWQAKIVREDILPPKLSQFREKYCILGGYYDKEIVGYKNTEDLARRLAEITLRASIDELQLPPLIETDVPVFLQEERQVYNRLERELKVELESETVTITNVLVKYLRLSQTTGGWLCDEPVGNSKLQVLLECLQSETGQAVIFARFLPEVRSIATVLKCPFIAGEVSGSTRDRFVDEFQSGKHKYLVCQLAAGGIAITLTAANVAYFYSLDFDSSHYWQARGRIYRGGQTKTCRIVHLVAEDTIDEMVLSAVRDKLSAAQTIERLMRRMRNGSA